MKNAPRLILAALLGLMLALTGCRSKKTPVQPEPVQPAQTATPDAMAAGLNALLASYSPWTDVKVPVAIQLTQPVSQKISGTLTMVNGRAVGLQLRMLGFEVGSLALTRDSIYVRERVKKTYVEESLADLLGGLPLQVDDLQALLLGHLFAPGTTAPKASDFTTQALPAPGAWSVTPRRGLPGGYLRFLAVGSRVLGATAGPDRGRVQSFVTYSEGDWARTPAGPVSPSVTIEVEGAAKPVAATITLSLDRAKWNTGAGVSIPSQGKNRRLRARQLIEMLSKL